MARSTAGPLTSCPFILSDVLELEARMCNSFRVPHSRVHRRCGMSNFKLLFVDDPRARSTTAWIAPELLLGQLHRHTPYLPLSTP